MSTFKFLWMYRQNVPPLLKKQFYVKLIHFLRLSFRFDELCTKVCPSSESFLFSLGCVFILPSPSRFGYGNLVMSGWQSQANLVQDQVTFIVLILLSWYFHFYGAHILIQIQLVNQTLFYQLSDYSCLWTSKLLLPIKLWQRQLQLTISRHFSIFSLQNDKFRLKAVHDSFLLWCCVSEFSLTQPGVKRHSK